MNAVAELAHRPQLYSATQLRELERRAIAELGVPGYTLMQRAARAGFAALRGRWPRAQRVAVLCGPGNNGGDGYEIARLARAAGIQVDLAQVGALPLAGDAVSAHAAWAAEGGEVTQFDAGFANLAMRDADVICDAIFGIGITRKVEGAAAAAIAAINARRPEQGALAVDIPSGLGADSGAVHGLAVRADLSIAFIGRKLGSYTGEGPNYCGAREFSALDLPPDFVGATAGLAELLDVSDLPAALPRRARTSHKGRHGHVLIVGGDHGMAGAALLAARAALRSGAGLVSVATRASHAVSMAMAQPETMCHAVEHAAELDALIAACGVVAIGPGLGRGDWGRTMLARALAADKPLVLDADALNLLAENPQRLPADCVLTPHPAEAGRLLGNGTPAIQADRVAAVTGLARRYGAICVLKGAGTLVLGSRLALCPYGNPGMGVGGMGDVLTGVIGALRAQGLGAEMAARIGVLVHALTGDRAAAGGERGLLPGDLIEQLRAVLNP